MIGVDATSFLVIVATAAIASLAVTVLGPACCATELPLVVAITTLAQSVGEMRASTATALVGAAIISTLAFRCSACGCVATGLASRRTGPHGATEPLATPAEAGAP